MLPIPYRISQQTSPVAITAARGPLNPRIEKQLLGVREVASYLGLSTSPMWRHVQRKNLPAPLNIGGSTRWRKADLEGFLEAQRSTAPSAKEGV